ncbi:MAG: tetratricopeptide repeat protein [Chitinophagaceae bacterium]|nr:MAG: tetratricopeptide repeat protein [Chitinophagaceae bacterium]
MKRIAFLFAACFLLYFSGVAQNRVIDSLRKDLSKQKTDTGRAITLYNLSYNYNIYKPDSALLLAQQAYELSKKNKFLRGESWALNSIANAFHALHNYPKAIEYFIEQLKIEEKRGIPENMGSAYLSIALVYNSERDTKKALSYAFKAHEIAKQHKLPELALFAKLNIGDIYEKANQLNQAMTYTKQAYELSLLQKDDLITGTSLNNMGNIYLKRRDYVTAHTYYTKSIPYLEAMEDYNTLSECNLGLAKIYEYRGKIDSAVHYAKKVYVLASKNEFLKRAADAGALLAQLYKKQNKIDSAFAYQEIMIKLSDSVDSKERAKEVQSITIGEEFRQKEIEELQKREAEDRTQKLQLLAIGIFIPILFFITVFLSQKRVNKKVIEYSGIVSLLMLFEYLTLFIHPFVAEKSHHSPLIEIIIFVIIASLLTPTHHKVEVWLIGKLSKIHEHHSQIHQKAKEKPEPEEPAEEDR